MGVSLADRLRRIQLFAGDTEEPVLGVKALCQAVFLPPHPTANSGGNNRKGLSSHMASRPQRALAAAAMALVPVTLFSFVHSHGSSRSPVAAKPHRAPVVADTSLHWVSVENRAVLPFEQMVNELPTHHDVYAASLKKVKAKKAAHKPVAQKKAIKHFVKKKTFVEKHSGQSAASPSFKSSSAPLVLGYYVPGQSALTDLEAHANQINAVAPFWYSLRVNGTLHDMGSSAALTSWCQSHHIAVYPMVINGYGNDNILQNPSYFRQDLTALIKLAATSGYAGLNIDFESLNNPDEGPLDSFVAQLAAGLHQEGKKLIVSVGPRTSDQNGYYVYNYRSLGQSADYVDLMLYDEHDNGGLPGPVAALWWTRDIMNYARQTIPASKILVGLAGYGYNWASTGSTELNDRQALALANQYGSTWDGGTVQEPEVNYSVNGVQHTVWFEDSASEANKVKWVSQYRLGGVALWDLGEENAGVWPMLKNELP